MLPLEIVDIMRRQHGAISLHQLESCGVSRHSAARRARNGEWYRPHAGVYALATTQRDIAHRASAAALASAPDAFVTGAAAASVRGVLRRPAPSIIHVVSPRCLHRTDGIWRTRSTLLLPTDGFLELGMPMASIPRMLLDLGRSAHAYTVANVMHETAFRHRLDLEAVGELLARTGGDPASRVLARALGLHVAGSAGTRSSDEDLAIAKLLARHEEPLVNERLPAALGGHEPDLRWEREWVIVEVDPPHHLRPKIALVDDPVRDDVYRALGYEVIRLVPPITDAKIDRIVARVRARRRLS